MQMYGAVCTDNYNLLAKKKISQKNPRKYSAMNPENALQCINSTFTRHVHDNDDDYDNGIHRSQRDIRVYQANINEFLNFAK